MNPPNDRPYLLSDREDHELHRLRIQHEVWHEVTDQMLQRANLKKGDTILDIGCGPGYLSLDLSRLVGPEGKVVAIDSSERFIDALKERCAREKICNVTSMLADVREFRPRRESINGAVSRWLFMFLSNPDRVVATVAGALAPNGMFAVMEYCDFRSISVWPRKESFDRVYRCVYELIGRSGGDADVGDRVPAMFVEHGLEVVDSYTVHRKAKPHSPLWKWLEMTAVNHSNLVQAGLITQRQLDEYYSDWESLSAQENAFLNCPPICVTIGRKKV